MHVFILRILRAQSPAYTCRNFQTARIWSLYQLTKVTMKFRKLRKSRMYSPFDSSMKSGTCPGISCRYIGLAALLFGNPTLQFAITIVDDTLIPDAVPRSDKWECVAENKNPLNIKKDRKIKSVCFSWRKWSLPFFIFSHLIIYPQTDTNLKGIIETCLAKVPIAIVRSTLFCLVWSRAFQYSLANRNYKIRRIQKRTIK